MKIAINRNGSYFGLSKEAVDMLIIKGMTVSKREVKTGNIFNPKADIIDNTDGYSKEYNFYDDFTLNDKNFPKNRIDSRLIEVIERLGRKWASGDRSFLKIIEIPDDVDYLIKGHTDVEYIEEKHRIWC